MTLVCTTVGRRVPRPPSSQTSGRVVDGEDVATALALAPRLRGAGQSRRVGQPPSGRRQLAADQPNHSPSDPRHKRHEHGECQVLGEQPVQGDREPAPQVPCPPLPHQMGAVVVAVATQGLPEGWVARERAALAGGVDPRAGHRTGSDLAPGVAGGAAARGLSQDLHGRCRTAPARRSRRSSNCNRTAPRGTRAAVGDAGIQAMGRPIVTRGVVASNVLSCRDPVSVESPTPDVGRWISACQSVRRVARYTGLMARFQRHQEWWPRHLPSLLRPEVVPLEGHVPKHVKESCRGPAGYASGVGEDADLATYDGVGQRGRGESSEVHEWQHEGWCGRDAHPGAAESGDCGHVSGGDP